MLTLPSSLRVFAKTGPTDMRKSFEGLVGVVERELGQQVESGDLFLFFNRRGDRVKVLWFAGDGLVIWYKKQEEDYPLSFVFTESYRPAYNLAGWPTAAG
jgi:transposase